MVLLEVDSLSQGVLLPLVLRTLQRQMHTKAKKAPSTARSVLTDWIHHSSNRIHIMLYISRQLPTMESRMILTRYRQLQGTLLIKNAVSSGRATATVCLTDSSRMEAQGNSSRRLSLPPRTIPQLVYMTHILSLHLRL